MIMEFTKQLKAYVLVDPNTEIPRYVGITKRSLGQRFSGHLRDIYNRPELNPHKTNWFKKLLSGGQIPYIKQVAEFDTVEEMKQFEIDYIAKYKEKYRLVNLTKGGDYLGEHAHTRESILKKKATRAVEQYNVLGEKIAEYEIMEDIGRAFNLQEKACSHITQCCKHTRTNAYGYIWRYKGDPLGDISNVNPKSLSFNKLVQYDLEGNRIAEFETYKEASETIGDNSKGGNIAAVITGRQKSCKGFIFKIEPIYVYYNQSKFDEIYKQDRSHTINKLGKIIVITFLDQHEEEFPSFSSAAKALNMYSWRTKIKECCENIRSDINGYKFRYKGSL